MLSEHEPILLFLNERYPNINFYRYDRNTAIFHLKNIKIKFESRKLTFSFFVESGRGCGTFSTIDYSEFEIWYRKIKIKNLLK